MKARISYMDYNGYYIVVEDENGRQLCNQDLDRYLGISYIKYAERLGAFVEESAEGCFDVWYHNLRMAIKVLKKIQPRIVKASKERSNTNV